MPIPPLSTAALQYMLESDWLYPSDYEPTQGSTAPERYEMRVRKPMGHSLSAPLRQAARLVCRVGVTALIAPFGILYHQVQATRQLNKRVAHLNASRQDAEFCQLFLIGMASLAASTLLPYLNPFDLTNRAFSYLCYLNGITLLCFQGIKTLFPLLHPIGEAESLNILNPCFNRWEFNCKEAALSPEKAFRDRQDRLFDTIRSLQSRLPEKMKMPAYQHPVIVSVLDWIEEKKGGLQQQGLWDEVCHSRDSILSLKMQLEEIERYLKSPPDPTPQQLKDAFALQGEESSVDIVLRQRDRIVGAFSLECFKKMCGSDWFFPSEYARIPRERSLSDVLSSPLPFAERTKISLTPLKKSRCFLARSIAFVAIGIIGAPTGIAYHAAQSTRWRIQALFQSEAERHTSLERSMGHVSALWTDLSYLLTGGHTLTLKFLNPKRVDKYMPLYLIGTYLMGRGALWTASCVPLTTILAAAVASSILFSAFSAVWSPESLIPSFAYRDERSALFKALAMRQRFGIEADGGGLLPYNKVANQKIEDLSRYDAELMRLWVSHGVDALELLKEEYLSLPETEREAFNALLDPYHYHRHLSSHFEQRAKTGRTGAITSNRGTRWQQLHDERNELRRLLEECYRLQHRDPFQREPYAQVADFPFSAKEIKWYLGIAPATDEIPQPRSNSSISPEWERFILIERETLKRTGDTWERLQHRLTNSIGQDLLQTLVRLIQLVSAKSSPAPWEILGLSKPFSSNELKHKWKEYALRLHPDKHPGPGQEDFALLFKIASEAYRCSLTHIQ